MKIMKKLTLLFVVTLGLLVGCKTDSTTSTSTEMPVAALMSDNTLSDITLNDTTINSSYYEFGYEFNVTKNGKITQLGTHIPDASTVRVTVWDLSDTSVIAQASISALAHTAKYVTLATPVSLIVGKKYAVTILSNDWYYRHRPGFIDYVYPITKGNITFTKYGYRSASSLDPAIYPISFNNADINGIGDFTFETVN